jgi:hypothetical protein
MECSRWRATAGAPPLETHARDAVDDVLARNTVQRHPTARASPRLSTGKPHELEYTWQWRSRQCMAYPVQTGADADQGRTRRDGLKPRWALAGAPPLEPTAGAQPQERSRWSAAAGKQQLERSR